MKKETITRTKERNEEVNMSVKASLSLSDVIFSVITFSFRAISALQSAHALECFLNMLTLRIDKIAVRKNGTN